MPTYMLDGDRSVTITAGPFRAAAMSTAGSADVVLVPTGRAVHSIAPRPGLLVVPRLSDAAVLRVVPIGATEFAVGASIGLTVEREAAGGEPERVVIGPIDVAGLRHRDLLLVEPAGDRIVVGSVAVVREAELTDVAAATRAAARAAENASPSTAPSRELAIAVDASASMAARYRDGAVGAVIEMIAGLDALVPKGSTLPVALVDQRVDWQSEADPSLIVPALRSLPDRRTLGSTADFRGVAAPPASDGRTRVLVCVTDEPSAVSTPGAHTVLLLARSAATVAGVDTAATVIEPIVDGAHIPERLGAAPAEFRAVVESLLRGLAAAGEEVSA
ncbi:hypothetical protein [Curtobacterium sp. PhB115]|uniref:hypothetical protein n=1 Tax=Curtobacterium sp. PhB115 TaxID=2485173 RepID=UPI000F4BD869|nr:hypothetical protein [Curtobacterium sp. PhB115]ROP64134.1 hypothetical protein EDF19_3079 [Curtobacterium sp. PhB115]